VRSLGFTLNCNNWRKRPKAQPDIFAFNVRFKYGMEERKFRACRETNRVGKIHTLHFEARSVRKNRA
jgi:hypothetical protein